MGVAEGEQAVLRPQRPRIGEFLRAVADIDPEQMEAPQHRRGIDPVEHDGGAPHPHPGIVELESVASVLSLKVKLPD